MPESDLDLHDPCLALQGKQLKLYSVMPPHMLSFWINVAAFFTR